MSLCTHNSVQWICESIGLTGIDQFWEWFFRGSPLPPGSWSGNIVNRKPPRGGGSFRSKYAKDITMIFLFGLPLNNVISLYMHIYITIKCAFSDTVPTNKICHRASSEQRPRTRSGHESERLVFALFRSNVPFWKSFFADLVREQLGISASGDRRILRRFKKH